MNFDTLDFQVAYLSIHRLTSTYKISLAEMSSSRRDKHEYQVCQHDKKNCFQTSFYWQYLLY